MRPALNTFVRVSAGFCSPGHLMSAKSPERTHSCSRSWATARCLTRPIPARRQIPIAALLSAQTSRAVSYTHLRAHETSAHL
eukprot:13140179-Alexandrium_andersonii.AAC.1